MIGSLEIDDFTYPLIEYYVGFKKKMDYTGIPAAIGVLQTIKVTYINTPDIELQQWSIDEGMLKDAVLTLFSDGLGERDQRFEFFDVHCTGYEQRTKNLGKTIEKTTTLHLEAAIVRHHGETLEKHWRKTNLSLRSQTPMRREDEETVQGTIGDSYFEDKQGNKIQNPKAEKDVVLKINTSEMLGKSIDIALGNPEIGFLYKDKPVPGNRLRNIEIREAITTLQLKTTKKQ